MQRKLQYISDIALMEPNHAAGYIALLGWYKTNYREIYPELTDEKYNQMALDKMVELGALDAGALDP